MKTSDTPGVQGTSALPFDRAAVFTIWQGMQYQGGITTEAQAMLFAQQVLAAHGVPVPHDQTFSRQVLMPGKENP